MLMLYNVTFLAPSHMKRNGKRKATAAAATTTSASSDVWKAIFAGDMVKEPLWWFSFLRYSHSASPSLILTSHWTDGLFKKSGIVVVVFFYRPYMETFSRKRNLFRHHHRVCVHSDAIRYFHLHKFRCGSEAMEWNWGKEVEKKGGRTKNVR